MLHAMDYPIQSPGQLSSHLRALRKARGLSQVQLGSVLGVGQTRVTRIERDPAAISVEQFLGVLNALGVQMVLRATGTRQAKPGSEPW
jgi:HTH-type transcriptional regulator/antitoxin HipB